MTLAPLDVDALLRELDAAPPATPLRQLSTVRDRRALTIPALLAASALCVATVEFRGHHTGDTYYRFLVWNLFLAWVPFLFALGAYAVARRGGGPAVVVLGILWLLFFPNAPYLITDFIHLSESPFGAALVRRSDARVLRLDGARPGVRLALPDADDLAARSGAGPCVGRCPRRARARELRRLPRPLPRLQQLGRPAPPARIAHVIRSDLENPFQHPRLFASLLVLTASLSVAYTVLYSFTGLRMELERR